MTTETKSENSEVQLESELFPVKTHDAQNTIGLVNDAPIATEEPVNEKLMELDTEIFSADETKQVENAIRPAKVKVPSKDLGEAQKGGSSEDGRIIKADPSKNAQTMVSKSPVQLLNRRFVLGEKGEYRRQGEMRVALVDEIEQIRFIDKQMDAFQAGVELAKFKGWEAIEVIGTEKFRSEAWFHARMAGLEVVGYEANDSDLKRLAAAQNIQKLDDKSVEESRIKAINFAIKKGAGLQQTNEEVGCYSGSIMLETDHHFVQDLGRKVAVLHEKKCFDNSELSQALSGRGSLKVQYQSGYGVASKGRDRGHGFSR